uniref:Thioredoxin domain-containing protein n=1 Tax=Ditylenchus dipsaci TaxID=166011 RepID=A0A915CNK1_9BILA
MIHTHSIEQRELQNPSQHIVNNQYIAAKTTPSSASIPPSSNSIELDQTVDEYIDELVQDQFQLAYTQYIHTHTQQPQEQNSIQNHLLHAPTSTFNYAGLSSTITKLLKTFTITRMLTWCLLFWSLSSLVKYALFTDRALPTREAALPLPFFNNASSLLVEDYFRGNGADKSLLMSKAELTILMFYAPWSLHSMEARQPFLEVAAAFKDLGNQTVSVFKLLSI